MQSGNQALKSSTVLSLRQNMSTGKNISLKSFPVKNLGLVLLPHGIFSTQVLSCLVTTEEPLLATSTCTRRTCFLLLEVICCTTATDVTNLSHQNFICIPIRRLCQETSASTSPFNPQPPPAGYHLLAPRLQPLEKKVQRRAVVCSVQNASCQPPSVSFFLPC